MLTIKQFADKLGVSRQRIHYLMQRGRISPAPKRVGTYYVLQNHARIKMRRG
jgi:DNA-binding transcriptional MerR regulator